MCHRLETDGCYPMGWRIETDACCPMGHRIETGACYLGWRTETIGCPRNEPKKISVWTKNNWNKICFGFVSVCFVKPKTKNFGLFRCFEPISKQSKHQNSLFRYRSETTETSYFETNQNKPKQTGKTLNFLKKYQKYAPYQTVLVVLLFVSVQSKHRKSLFRYRSETTETNILFQIMPQLVLVLVSVVLNRN